MRFQRSVLSFSFASVAAIAVAFSMPGCGSKGNTGQVTTAVPTDDAGKPIVFPALPNWAEPIASGLPDPGAAQPSALECAKLEQLEFSKGLIDTFEPNTTNGGTIGTVPGYGVFDDLTRGAKVIP